MMLRPMRPNPLMPTFTAIDILHVHRIDARARRRQTIHSNERACGGSNRPAILRYLLSHCSGIAVYLLYSLLTLVVFVVVSPYFLYQAIRYKKYIGSLRQRLGYLPISFNVDGEESIWIHAVSVGEVLTARALAADLKARYPRLRLFLSTTTMAGQQVARRSLQHVDARLLLPVRLGVHRPPHARTSCKPRLFIMMETEIWPNLLRECRRARREDGRDQRPHLVALVSALPADPPVLPPRARRRRSLLHAERGIGAAARRPRRRPGARHGHRQPEVRLARACRRATAHGKPRERVLRFFRVSPNRPVDRRRQHDARRGGGGAARVRARQDDDAERAAGARAAPSRAVRRSGAPGARRGLRHGAALASCRSTPSRAPTSSSLDTIGELAQLYQVATVVFVGGSLVGSRRPQHPRAGDLRQADRLRAAHAELRGDRRRVPRPTARPCRCSPSASSTTRCSTLVTDPVRRARLGAAARALVEANRGAKDKTLAVIADLLPPARRGRRGPAVPPGPLILSTLSSAVRRGGGVAAPVVRAPIRRAARRLARPVVSVGNLRVGGSGKTPIVAHIARLLRRRAASGPPILTRGYGRRDARDGVTVVSDGTRVLAGLDARGRRAADARARAARACRCSSARIAICRAASPNARLGATVHLLDDGFQHLAARARRRSAASSTRTT